MRTTNSILKDDHKNKQTCPIPQEPPQDPDTTTDGYTSGKKAILEWFEKNWTSPNANMHLASKETLPDHAFRHMIVNIIPKFLIQNESQKQQMKRQIAKLKLKFEQQRNKFQKLSQQLKSKHLEEIQQLKFRSEMLLVKKKKLIQQFLIDYDCQKEQKQRQVAKLKLNYEQYKQKFENQSQQLKSKHLEEIQELKFRYEMQLVQKNKQIQQQSGQKEKKQPNELRQIDMSQTFQTNVLKQENDFEVSLNNLLKQSSILDREGLQLLIKWLIKPITKIQFKFKASENEFKLSKFFETCGDLINTIIIAKTTKGKIIGGYTPLSFNPPGNQWTHTLDIQPIKDESNSSFLFSLSEKEKFQLKRDYDAIFRYKNKQQIQFNFTFYIKDNSNINRTNQFQLWTASFYNTSKYPYTSEQSYLKITGQQNQLFLTAQWQVYQVFFQ